MWSKNPTPVLICGFAGAVEVQLEHDFGLGRLSFDPCVASHMTLVQLLIRPCRCRSAKSSASICSSLPTEMRIPSPQPA